MLVRRKLIRERAEELLNRFGVKKAPVDVERLAERLGLEVAKESAADSISGFILRDPRRRKVLIGVNANHHENRQRFTIAHECGHFLLHEGERLHVDNARGYQIRLRSPESSAGTKIDEMEANLFAAELLMPVRFLDDDLAKIIPASLGDDETIKKLANKYQVSPQAMTLRLSYLGYIVQ